MMRPVGVGLMSRGPMGVDGATITAGSFSSRDHAFDFALGQKFAFLVDADGAFLGVARGLVHRLALAGLQGGDGRGIDHPLHTRLKRGLHGGAGAFQIVAGDFHGIAGPKPVIGGDMEQIARAFQRLAHGADIAHVAAHDVHIQARDIGARRGRPHQHAHLEAAIERLARNRRADKTRCARDQDSVAHDAAPPRNAARASMLCQ